MQIYLTSNTHRVKLAASIESCSKASRQSTEFPAKSSMASDVSRNKREDDIVSAGFLMYRHSAPERLVNNQTHPTIGPCENQCLASVVCKDARF